GVFFDPNIPWKEREHLHEVICGLDPWSTIGQFAFGRYTPQLGTGTEVIVTQSWHQESAPHITVMLRYVENSNMGGWWPVASGHIYLDGSESLDWHRHPYRWHKQVGEKKYSAWLVSNHSCLLKTDQQDT
ncbi:hypothetical protein BKA66DRAFT_418512, partial [Pyrenochaeta sp. MPI-SDFR-AT-0127]